MYVLIVVATVVFILWKMSKASQGPAGTSSRREAPRGPDDDPEFLRKL